MLDARSPVPPSSLAGKGAVILGDRERAALPDLLCLWGLPREGRIGSARVQVTER
ncbi:hypothetical protein GCM10010236_10970 [Streptomyces eurythermus]|nr:hypothetical protein GCM10010236_10970 [Streptomyces eurythermus]